MKSTLQKILSLIISVIIAFGITGFLLNSRTGFAGGFKSGAVYAKSDEDLKTITVIPTDTEKITEDKVSEALKKTIELSDGELLKNAAKIIIDNKSYSLIIKGDAVPDGKITAGDARAILRIAARLDNAGDAVFAAADIDSDGKITASEARDVLRFVSKLTNRLFNYSESEYAYSEKSTESIAKKEPEILTEAATVKQNEPTAEITAEVTKEVTSESGSEAVTEFTANSQPETTSQSQPETTSQSQPADEPSARNDSENISLPYEEEESSSPETESKKTVWIAIGDSKTDFNNNGVSRPDNYPYWIVKRNPHIELINLGSAGGMITNERVNKAGDTEILYPSMYKKATEINVKPDIITVAGGFNDWNWGVPLGEFTTDISAYDTSADANIANSGNILPFKNTFYMGVFRLALYLKTEYPDTPILWITPCPTAVNNYGGANGNGVNQPLSAYVQAIKDVCAYFSIPVCDMSSETTVPYRTSWALKKYWRGSDGIHPNGIASEIYSFKIEEYMKKVYESFGYKWDIK